jgi:PAS domain S-box-containing protein
MDDDFLIVGIGASAGGIRALKRFFDRVEPESGMAYVVILHLSPDHESRLAEVLQTSTPVPVRQVTDRTKLLPNHVYVISPNRSLALADGHLVVSEFTGIDERRAPVDVFFRTLAATHGPRAVSVVLSGTGADGSMGMKRVKEAGGLCVVQEPDDADYSDMPRHAIATGLADYVLDVDAIPARLSLYRAGRREARVLGPVEPDGRLESSLREIFTHLRFRTGHDFSNYKPGTVLRRIERRMSVIAVPTIAEYVQALRARQEEAGALLKDLLISVTVFFRDPTGFAFLDREVLPVLLRDRDPRRPIRIWVPGCATGEEAYSLAMLFAEHVDAARSLPPVQIFATDLDEAALAVGRAGVYTLNDAADVSPERLRRFFVEERNAFRVRQEIREQILFAPHDLLRDPPFSHLDLVSCRNVLIYLNRLAQRRVLTVMHFALEPGAYLFLGASESVEGSADLFTTVDKDGGVFQARATTARISLPAMNLAGTASRVPLSIADHGGADRHGRSRGPLGELHHRLVEQYAPPSLLLNDDHDIVHLSERVGRYLRFTGGEPSHQFLDAVWPELRIELRSALYQAARTGLPVHTPWIAMVSVDSSAQVKATVRPMARHGDERGLYLVLFTEAPLDGSEPVPAPQSAEPVVLRFEEELTRVKGQLRGTVEQYEAQTGELKASNEELQAMNEELRSSAEELETSKEELQSVNEELITVNQELKVKVEEQAQAANDIQNLITAGEMGTIFLDRQLRIKLFTPRARDLFNVIASDLGRPLTDINSAVSNADLAADVQSVLDTLLPLEREVQTHQGRWFNLRILPYRTAKDRIDGVVLSFADVTRRRSAESDQSRLAADQRRQGAILDRLPVGVVVVDDARRLLFVNREARRLLTTLQGTGEALTLSGLDWAPEDARSPGERAVFPTDRALAGEAVPAETIRIGRGDSTTFVSISAVRLSGSDDDRDVVVVTTLQDVTLQRRVAQQAQASDERLRLLADVVPDLLWSSDEAGRVDWYNQRWLDYTGQSAARAQEDGWLAAIHPDDRQVTRNTFDDARSFGRDLRMEHRLRGRDGVYRWFLLRVRPLRESAGTIVRWFAAATDIDDMRRAEDQIRSSESQLRLIVESLTDHAIASMDRDGRILSWNPGAVGAFGYSAEEAVGQRAETLFVRAAPASTTFADERRIAETTGSAADEGWHLRKDGSRFFASGTLHALRDAAGGVAGYVKIARDLTARQEVEDRLRQAHDELEVRIADRTRELAMTNEALELEAAERRSGRARVTSLLRRLVTVQEDERRRVARDLHDHLGQLMTALRLQLDSMRSRTAEQIGEALDRAEHLASRIDADVDFLAWELRSGVEDSDLCPALASFVQEWSRHVGVPAAFHHAGVAGVPLSRDVALNLYRIAQEALNNVLKHAAATHVDVLLELRDGVLTLIVEDDGRGFDAENPPQRDGRGIGLVSMRERAALLGGALEVETAVDDGTTVYARVPPGGP